MLGALKPLHLWPLEKKTISGIWCFILSNRRFSFWSWFVRGERPPRWRAVKRPDARAPRNVPNAQPPTSLPCSIRTRSRSSKRRSTWLTRTGTGSSITMISRICWPLWERWVRFHANFGKSRSWLEVDLEANTKYLISKLNSSWVIKLMDRGKVTWPRGEYWVDNTLIIGHIARVEYQTTIRPMIWPRIMAEYQVFF